MSLGNLSSASLLYPQAVYEHYLIPLFTFPIFMVPIIFKWLRPSYDKRAFITLSSAILALFYIIILYKAYEVYKTKSFKSQYYTPIAKCVDEFVDKTKAKYGIAGYWESKSISMLSHHNIDIAQFTYNLNKFLAVNSTDTYRDFYDFALIKNKSLNRDKIIKLNGEPSEVFKCQHTTNSILSKLRDKNISSDISKQKIKYNSKSVIFQGWYPIENGFRWGKGKSAKILFKIDPKKIKGYLKLDLIPLGKQQVTIYINSHKVATKKIDSKDSFLSLKFYPRWLFRYDINELELKFSNPHYPKNGDKRELAVAIKSFEID